MAYPIGTPSENFTSGIFFSDFSPAIVVGAIIDNHTPVSNLGMKNSVGYQIALVQNYVNRTYLGRSDQRVATAYVRDLGLEGMPTSGVYAQYIRVPDGEFTVASGMLDINTKDMSLRSSGLLIKSSGPGDINFTGDGQFNITGSDHSSIMSITSSGMNITSNSDLNLGSNAGNVVSNSNVVVKNNSIYGSGYVIADDTFVKIIPGAPRGMVMINTDFGGAVYATIVAYDTVFASSDEVASYGSWDGAAAPLNGTTGSDGQATTACDSSGIYLENRLGGTKTFSVTFIGQ